MTEPTDSDLLTMLIKCGPPGSLRFYGLSHEIWEGVYSRVTEDRQESTDQKLVRAVLRDAWMEDQK